MWAVAWQVNAEREEALKILGEQGMLLVQCSLIDNMPYVVAEAAVRALAPQMLLSWTVIPACMAMRQCTHCAARYVTSSTGSDGLEAPCLCLMFRAAEEGGRRAFKQC